MNEPRRVYLDNNATTPVHPKVIEAMLPFFKDGFGNPSSGHAYGRFVKNKISESREIVANAIGAEPSEIIFTSGGTEADNIAICGSAAGHTKKTDRTRLVTTTIEHPAVLETVKHLAKNGYEARYMPVDNEALVNPDSLNDMINNETAIVSVMHANNEVGTIQPIREISEIAKSYGALMHTDAVQTFTKIPINVDDVGVDLLSLSGHKINGPKGIGALYIRKGSKIKPIIHGGHHEFGLRAGTENVAGIIGLAEAVRIGIENLVEDANHAQKMRDELEKRITKTIPFVRLNGHREKRIPNTLNMSFECVEGEALLINLDMAGIAISTGSACSSGSLDPSHVLLAMGIPHEIVHGSLRFSFGPTNTIEDIDYVMTHLPRIIDMVRQISPLWDSDNGKVLTVEEAAIGSLHVGH
ncbi:MAG TPA: cysteine desulfurase NifS [Nitrospinota bacterium]|nr:cysteine desulfurase NifS [Nitrospinota bacterium]|tara:strand:+ start:148404 stop:149639 length:1236 start_codon:yes stop_codon:yes gene_type:complete